MLDFLRAIETAPPVEALKASFYIYPLVSALHIMAISAVFTTVLLMDFAIIRSTGASTPSVAVDRLKPLAFGAFLVAAATGLLLFSVNATEYAFNLAFRTKLVLIGVAGLNFAIFARLSEGRHEKPTSAMRSAAVFSILIWMGVIVAGRFIGFL